MKTLRLGGPLALSSLWLAAVAGACAGQSGAEVVEGPVGDSGGPDGEGAAECLADADCVQIVEERLEALRSAATRQVAVVESRCEPMNVILDVGTASGPACQCDFGDAGTRTLGPAGIGCSVLGRGGDCLFGDPEFAGCSVTEAGSCQASCEELAARINADAARAFEATVESATCDQGNCDSVARIDGRCFVNQSERWGRSYDCALSTEELLAAELAAQRGVLDSPLPATPGAYVGGTLGTFWLTVSRGFSAGVPQYDVFSASAHFATVTGDDGSFGNVIDPLQGVDDCGVVQRASIGVAADVDFFAVDEVALSDGSSSWPLALNSAANGDYFPYDVGLSELGVAPRYSQAYSLTASGGRFESPLAIDDITLPADLSIPSLEQVSRVPRGALALSWTGTGAEPLRVRLWVSESLGDGADPYEIECLLADDGEHVIPAAVLEAAPEGFVTASIRRENRRIRTSGASSLQTLASVDLSYAFALGEACDAAAVMAACEQHALVQRQVYEECGVLELPSVESICPAYLAESCRGCVEYFECASAGLRCEPDGLYSSSGCGCP